MDPLPMYGTTVGTDWGLRNRRSAASCNGGATDGQIARAKAPAHISLVLFHLETDIAQAVLTFDLQDYGIARF